MRFNKKKRFRIQQLVCIVFIVAPFSVMATERLMLDVTKKEFVVNESKIVRITISEVNFSNPIITINCLPKGGEYFIDAIRFHKRKDNLRVSVEKIGPIHARAFVKIYNDEGLIDAVVISRDGRAEKVSEKLLFDLQAVENLLK